MSKIVIAGCGPGSPDYVTPAVQRAVSHADVLVGAPRLLDLFPEGRSERIVVDADIEKVLREMAARKEGRRLVVLVTGDPGLCSLARPILGRFGREACEVLPGISSVQAAFAGIGMDWLDARIIDAHGENPKIEPASLLSEGKIAVFAGRREALGWIVGLVKILGGDRRIYLCENMTLPDERIRMIEAPDLEGVELLSRTIVLIVKEKYL